MEFEYLVWKQNQTLAEHYLRSFDQVKDRFEYDYRNRQSYPVRAQWLDANKGKRAPADAVVEALLHYNEGIGNDAETVRSVRKLLEPQTLVVVGGQQSGLLTGPLLVMHKAITILREAKRASEQLGRPVLPLFWIAGEDHDYDEVNHIYQLSGQLTIDKLEIEAPPEQAGKRITVSKRKFTLDQWQETLSKLEASLPQTEFKPDLMASLREIHAESDSLTEAFARTMAKLFGKHGLILLDSDDPALRRAESGLFRRLIDRNAELEQALLSGKSAVERTVGESSAEVKERGANLFMVREGERLLLSRNEEGATFQDKTGAAVYTADELRKLAESQPESFSNNVFTRPLMQDYLFPVVATVLGPGEISYWALTKEAFRTFDMCMPIIVPRLEFTIVEGTVKKQLDKLGLTFEEAVFRLEDKREAWLSAQDTFRIPERFDEAKTRFEALYAPILALVGSINPGLRSLGETNQQKIIEQMSFLETRAKDAFESQFEAAKRQFERIRLSFTPLGKKQERVYNGFAYLNKYGSAWLDGLVEADIESDGRHVVVYL